MATVMMVTVMMVTVMMVVVEGGWVEMVVST